MQQNVWWIDPGRVLRSESAMLDLVVKEVSGSVRYLVLRRVQRDGTGVRELLGSGTEDDTRSAMAAAERMAARSERTLQAKPAPRRQ